MNQMKQINQKNQMKQMNQINQSNIAMLKDEHLDDLLSYAPGYSGKNSENIDRLFNEKITKTGKTAERRKPAGRMLFAAAAAVLAVTLSVTALAATGVIDFGWLYNSIFSNPEADPYIIKGDDITITENPDSTQDDGNTSGNTSDNTAGNTSGVNIGTVVPVDTSIFPVAAKTGGIQIEPVAAFRDGQMDLYLQLKIIMLDDNPLPEMVFFLKDFNENAQAVWVGNSVAVTPLDGKTGIASFKTHDWQMIDGNICFSFDAVSTRWDKIAQGFAPAVYPGYLADDDVTYYGDWEIIISPENVQTLDTVFVDTNIDGVDVNVRIQAATVEITFYGLHYEEGAGLIEPVPYNPGGCIRLTLGDGSVVETEHVEMSGGYGADIINNLDENGVYKPAITSYWGNMPFINPADVVCVQLLDMTIFGQPGSGPIINADSSRTDTQKEFEAFPELAEFVSIEDTLSDVVRDAGSGTGIPSNTAELPYTYSNIAEEFSYSGCMFLPNSNGRITTITTLSVSPDNIQAGLKMSLYDCTADTICLTYDIGSAPGLGNYLTTWINLNPAHYYCLLIEFDGDSSRYEETAFKITVR